MSALHWICALTLALVCCLSAQPVKRNAGRKTEILDDLKSFKLIAENNCSNETSKLYSPSEIHEDCLHSALNCTIEELNILADNCDTKETPDDNLVFTDLKNGLLDMLEDLPNSTSNCPCEEFDTKDFKQFLENIKDLVQQLP